MVYYPHIAQGNVLSRNKEVSNLSPVSLKYAEKYRQNHSRQNHNGRNHSGQNHNRIKL